LIYFILDNGYQKSTLPEKYDTHKPIHILHMSICHLFH